MARSDALLEQQHYPVTTIGRWPFHPIRESRAVQDRV